MQPRMLRGLFHGVLITLLAALAACGGGGSGGMSTISTSGTMPLVISDASSDDWATVGVKVLSIALIPQGGGANVTVFTAMTPAPYVNLEQLDQLGEILGNASVPVGTYTGAVLTVGANPGDVLLTAAADPTAGFPVAAGSSVAGGQIQIQGAQGATGNLTVPVTVNFDSPLTVSAGANNALNLEFDLGHPAFIVGHSPALAAGATLWAVDFRAPLRRRPVPSLAALLLRHTYGTVTSVDMSNSFFTVGKDFPLLPVAATESAMKTGISLEIFADATNGTIFYDLDAQTQTVVKDFSAEAMSLPGKFVRVAARFQDDGKLVGVRVWASSDFSKVWLSPEGHVLRVNTTSDILWVTNEIGRPVPVSVDANTEFFFRAPANALADATPIGTGPGFLANHNIVRGFKVHVSCADPLAVPLVAQSIDIETAAYDGRISGANSTGFTYTRQFATPGDDYSLNLDYIAGASANTAPGGQAVMGFLWWDFTYPTLADTGSGAVADFVAATNGGVNFGGSVGALTAWGASAATWGDPANPGGWSLRNAVLVPTPVPLGTVTTAFAGNSFAMSVVGGAQPATVDVSTTMQSATLVYQVNRASGVITVTPIDVSTSAGQAALAASLIAGVPAKVYGVPQADSTLKAYVLVYFTGMLPAT